MSQSAQRLSEIKKLAERAESRNRFGLFLARLNLHKPFAWVSRFFSRLSDSIRKFSFIFKRSSADLMAEAEKRWEKGERVNRR